MASVRRLITAPGERKDSTVDLWMPKPKGKGQLSTRRDAEHRGAFGRQRHAEPRPYPSADFLDEKLLVCPEPLRVEVPESTREGAASLGLPVNAHHHRGRHIGRLQVASPLGIN